MKKGFSLAELLLCIAIIGIVSAMGVTITKKTTDRAYNLYYYTGYVNLYNAIWDARSKCTPQKLANGTSLYNVMRIAGGTIPQGNQWKYSELNTNYKNLLVPHIMDNLGVWEKANNSTNVNAINKIVQDGNRADGTEVTLKNGIEYIFYSNGINLRVIMIVPQKKERDPNDLAGRIKTAAVFDVQGINCADTFNLIPLNSATTPSILSTVRTVVDLQNRADLLPTYVDDGKVGRIGRSGKFEPIIYESFKEAYCRTNKQGLNGIITCPSNTIEKDGILKFGNPRRI